MALPEHTPAHWPWLPPLPPWLIDVHLIYLLSNYFPCYHLGLDNCDNLLKKSLGHDYYNHFHDTETNSKELGNWSQIPRNWLKVWTPFRQEQELIFNLDAHDLVSHAYSLYPDMLNFRLNCLISLDYLGFFFFLGMLLCIVRLILTNSSRLNQVFFSRCIYVCPYGLHVTLWHICMLYVQLPKEARR